MSMSAIDQRKYLKENTQLDPSFIDDFVEDRDVADESSINVNVNMIVKWLKCSRDAILRKVRKKFKEGVDYVEFMDRMSSTKCGWKQVRMFITPDVFKLLCIQSRSPQGDTLRRYFLELEKGLLRYNENNARG